jgi:hypothetical protein
MTIVFGAPLLPRVRHHAVDMVCREDLSALGKAMQSYASEHEGRYPSADTWCDLLIQVQHVDENQLVCKSAWIRGDKGPCHYGSNPNCKPTSPNDIVLLFETKAGWNQFGGPEILTTENHITEGSNILFNDGSVRFIKTRYLPKLKWQVQDTNSG